MAIGTSCNKENYNKLFTEMVVKQWNRGLEGLWDRRLWRYTELTWTVPALSWGLE